MSMLPFSSLFLSTLVIGSLISISSNHWILIWVGLELNLISFIPLLFLSNFNTENEAAMKYFLAQALGSSLLLIGGTNLYFSAQSLISSSLSSYIILLGLLTKLGLPPCHFWFPSVMNSLSWPLCLILSTWQKVAPLLILTYLFSSLSFITIALIITLSSLVGGVGGLSQSLLKPLLAYSSIGHMSWILAAGLSSLSSSLFYFLIYVIISSSIMFLLFLYNLFSLSSAALSSKFSWLIPCSLVLTFLSLGGVPPFLGFFPKWMVIQNLAEMGFFIPLILILGSLLNLFYYLNFLFISLINKNTPLFIFPSKSFHISSWLLILCSSSIFLAPIALVLF
uniref:NADH-ubiquinone oxidoreductase chain 2 n=1 Tax=Pisione sp. YZ-2018 TaxID=2153337 RepID=A0A343W6I0_9ANNE|nr:NADH dehydrogenase subunit 2 [Pisione sp. YZ-2018]